MTEHRPKGLQAEAELTAARAHLQALTEPPAALIPAARITHLTADERAELLAKRARRRGIHVSRPPGNDAA